MIKESLYNVIMSGGKKKGRTFLPETDLLVFLIYYLISLFLSVPLRRQQRWREGGRTPGRKLHHGNGADGRVRRVSGRVTDRFPGRLRVRQAVHKEWGRQPSVPGHRIRIFRTTAQHERVSYSTIVKLAAQSHLYPTRQGRI